MSQKKPNPFLKIHHRLIFQWILTKFEHNSPSSISVTVAKFCLSSCDSFSFIEYCFKGYVKHPKHCELRRMEKIQSDTDLCSLGSMKIGYYFLTNIEITFALPRNPMHQSWFTFMAFKPTLNTDRIKAPPDGFP